MVNDNSRDLIIGSLLAVCVAALVSFFVCSMYGSNSIAVVDLPRIVAKDSKVAVQVNKILEKYYNNIVSVSEQLKAEIADLEKSLEEKKSKLSNTAIAAEEKKIHELRTNLQIAFASYNYLNEKVREAVKTEINKELMKIIPDIAKNAGYEYVLNSLALYGYDELNKNSKYDITDEVIKRLDVALPSVDIKQITGLDLNTDAPVLNE